MQANTCGMPCHRVTQHSWKICNLSRIYGRIAKIPASYRKSGSANTMVTSDFWPEVESPKLLHSSAMDLWTRLWGRYHVSHNVFLVFFIFFTLSTGHFCNRIYILFIYCLMIVFLRVLMSVYHFTFYVVIAVWQLLIDGYVMLCSSVRRERAQFRQQTCSSKTPSLPLMPARNSWYSRRHIHWRMPSWEVLQRLVLFSAGLLPVLEIP